ncbi:MAG: MFS transporter [Bacteroidota bacterium]
MLKRTKELYRNSFEGLSRDVWLLSAVMLINRSGAMVLPFLSIYMTESLGFTMAEAGYVVTCWGAGSVLGVYLGGILTDRIGYYQTQMWSLVLTGLMFFVIVHVHDLWLLCGTMFLLTTIADTFRPANIAAVAVYSKPENRTRSISLIRMAINMGYAIGPAVGGFIVAAVGYYWLFWIDGFTCLFAALFFWLMLEQKEEKIGAPEGKEAAALPANALSPYRDKPYLLFIFLNILMAIAFLQIISATPVYFRQEVLMPEWQIGGIFAMNGLIIVALEMPMVYVLEKRFKLMQLVVIGTILIGLSYLVFNIWGPYLWVAIFSILLITFGEILHMPFANAFAMARSVPSNRGQYMALFSMSYSIAHIAGPFLGMQVAENFGFTTMWYLMVGSCALATIGFWWIKRQQDQRQENLEPEAKVSLDTTVPETKDKPVDKAIIEIKD